MLLLRDRRTDFEDAGVVPIGVSRDSPWSHVAWCQALDLHDLTLVSDWNAEAIRGFDVSQDYRGLSHVAQRSAFVLDHDRIVTWARVYGTGEVPYMDELVAASATIR